MQFPFAFTLPCSNLKRGQGIHSKKKKEVKGLKLKFGLHVTIIYAYMYVLAILLNGEIICTLKIIMITLIKKNVLQKYPSSE